MKPGRLRAVRWDEMSIVFQGALHTLNPVRRIGWQIERGDRRRTGRHVEQREVDGESASCSSVVGHPGAPGAPTIRTSSRAGRSSAC